MNPRKILIDSLMKTGRLLPLVELEGIDLSGTAPLDNLYGLTPEQALALVEFYGPGVVFAKEIETQLEGYKETRERIDDIEHRRR